MTEEEWLANTSPVAMLAHLNADGNSRKLLLYASALCALRPELQTELLRKWAAAVEAVLTYEAAPDSLNYWQENAEEETSYLAGHGPPAARAYYSVLADVVFCTWNTAPREYENDIPIEEFETVLQIAVSFVRDIFGNPFRPVTFSPDWRTDTAVSLAHTMYETRDFSAMPILADALQDAGCENEDILVHCRDTALTHGRGCWCVDQLLGKE